MTVRFNQKLVAVFLCMSAGYLLLTSGHAATASKAETLSGVVIEGGITCPMLKLGTGETISLMGVAAQKLPVGQTFSASGMFVRYSTCQQAVRTFRIDEILNPSQGSQ